MKKSIKEMQEQRHRVEIESKISNKAKGLNRTDNMIYLKSIYRDVSQRLECKILINCKKKGVRAVSSPK